MFWSTAPEKRLTYLIVFTLILSTKVDSLAELIHILRLEYYLK